MGKVANTGGPPKSTRGWSESPAWRGPWAGSRSAAGNLGARRGAQMRQRLDGLPATTEGPPGLLVRVSDASPRPRTVRKLRRPEIRQRRGSRT